jgi:hypothetical protein
MIKMNKYEQVVYNSLLLIGLDPVRDKEELEKLVAKYWPGVRAKKLVEDYMIGDFDKAKE